MQNYILEYWKEIQSGTVVVSNRVRKVYAKLVEDIESPKGKYIFDLSRANKPIRFIEQFCKHSKGEWAGKPVRLELFQKAYISALFGFIDKETRLRKYKETLFMVARKNGKSTMLAGIALYMLIADNEPGAEVYSTATKKDQARIVFDENSFPQIGQVYVLSNNASLSCFCGFTASFVSAVSFFSSFSNTSVFFILPSPNDSSPENNPITYTPLYYAGL